MPRPIGQPAADESIFRGRVKSLSVGFSVARVSIPCSSADGVDPLTNPIVIPTRRWRSMQSPQAHPSRRASRIPSPPISGSGGCLPVGRLRREGSGVGLPSHPLPGGPGPQPGGGGAAGGGGQADGGAQQRAGGRHRAGGGGRGDEGAGGGAGAPAGGAAVCRCGGAGPARAGRADCGGGGLVGGWMACTG